MHACDATTPIPFPRPPSHSLSRYTDVYRKKPWDTKPFSKTGGGYWFSARNLTQGAPFLATTTYRSDLLSGASTTSQQLEKTQGLQCTIVNYEAARQQRAQSAEPTMKRTSMLPVRPNTSVTSLGEKVGYQTTSAASIAKNPITGGLVAAGLRQPDRDAPRHLAGDPRYAVMPKAMAPGMVDSTSSYARDFGAEGGDPMERTAPNEKFQVCNDGLRLG